MNMLKKTAWLFTGRFLGDSLAFVFYIALARTFGESSIGDYAFAFSLAALFGLGVEFGLRPMLTRSVSRNRACVREYIGTVTAVQVGLTVVLGLMLHFLSTMAGYSDQVHVLLVLAFASIALRAIATSFVAYLEGIEAMDKSALLDATGKLAAAGCGLSLIFGGASLPVVMSGHVLGSVVYLVMAFYWVWRHFGPVGFRIEAKLARNILIAALPFALSMALYEMYARVDIIMLLQLVGTAEAGQYAVAVRLVMTPVVLAFMIGVAMFPTLSRSTNENSEARDALFVGTLKWLAIFGMTGTVLWFSIGGELLMALFGRNFANAARLVEWLAILFFLEFILVAYSRLLLATNREYTELRLFGISVGLNVVLNLLMIPRWGAYGAIWASIVSQGVLVVALHLICAKYIAAGYIWRAGRLLMAGAMAVAASLVLDGFVSWPILGLVTLSVLGIVAVVSGVITSTDYRKLLIALRGLTMKSVNR